MPFWREYHSTIASVLCLLIRFTVGRSTPAWTRWVSDVNDDIYDPTCTDMLRVAFTSEFGRGKLQDLVALLPGRTFETKAYEEAVAVASFAKLKSGIPAFMNKTHFDRITLILRSAGFVTRNLVSSQNAVNFACIVCLRGRAEKLGADDLERLVRRWYRRLPSRGSGQAPCRRPDAARSGHRVCCRASPRADARKIWMPLLAAGSERLQAVRPQIHA